MSEAASRLSAQAGDAEPGNQSSRLAALRTAGAIALLTVMAILAGGSALRESPTFDEIAHIGAGLSYADKLDTRFNPEHPPLEKLLSGVFMKLGSVRADYASPQWTLGATFPASFLCEWSFGDWVLFHWNDPHKVLFWARLPMLLITLVLGWIIYWMASRLGGPWAGLLCLSIFITTPTFLTFGPLVLTDVPIALFALLTVWSFASLWRGPSQAATWKFALCVAGGMLTKFSVLLLLIASLIAALSTRWAPLPASTDEPTERAEKRIWRRQRWFATWKGIAIGLVLTYLFDLCVSWNQPTGMLARYIPPAALRRILMPVVNSLVGAFLILAPNRPAVFLLGRSYPHGTWLFFPVLFLLKSIPAFLVFLSGALALGIWLRKSTAPRLASTLPARYQLHWRFLWVALSVYAAVCVLSKLDISIRHFTIPIAFSILLVAPLPRLIGSLAIYGPRIPRMATALAAVLAIDLIVVAVSHYPWFMPYHNVLAGNRPGYELFGDSNLDWNQGLFAVEDFARAHGLQRIPLDFYGSSEPEPVIPEASVWDCQVPSAADAGQWVAVSANVILDAQNCGWLLNYHKEAIAGGSMYAFQLPSPVPPAGAAGGPPFSKDRRVLLGEFGEKDLRTLFLDLERKPETIQDATKAMMEQGQKPPKK